MQNHSYKPLHNGLHEETKQARQLRPCYQNTGENQLYTRDGPTGTVSSFMC
jgi:hypothetical protein